MFHGFLAFGVAALMALVAMSGSQDRGPLRVTSDTAATQAAQDFRQIH
ncbi:hypothetical protein [Loktanella sp. Alg231-35]|nr:hypothetical protein [Loktanella sp. Alg231-35]